MNFTENELHKNLKDSKEFTFIANYSRKSGYKYLYLYPRNYDDQNKALIKIYFKEILDSSTDIYIDYLNSNYSSIDFNTGLFIKLDRLNSDLAKVFILSYQVCNLQLLYKYTNEISFPSYIKYNNFLLNQFILPAGKTQEINFEFIQYDNVYLLILSKTSLKNIEVKGKYKGEDVTNEKLAFLYPNGCSFFIDKDSIDQKYMNMEISIKNKDTINDDVILLGYVHHKSEYLFPNELVNGFQLYLEGNKNRLYYLINKGNMNIDQYFTYQTFSKNLIIDFLNSNNEKKYSYITNEYNSMFSYNANYVGKIRFDFEVTQIRNALYIQYLDYYDIEIAQKSLQPLVTGVPKSMIIPQDKSMYHFLPIEKNSNKLNYYLKPKTKEKIYVSFEICRNYPDNCTFSGKTDNAVEPIENIGLWYTLPSNQNELQLIYIYCEKECRYDILMTYDEEPLFLFPDNDYTKFIGDSNIDMISLPVFEYFNTTKIKSIYIDLTIISGKAKLILKNSRDGDKLTYSLKKIGNKQTYNISSDIFLKDEHYYKKEIYAVIEQDKNIKNTIYNIMYSSSGALNLKLLSNNIVNIEYLNVGEKGKESTNSKIFQFINNDDNNELYISISTKLCKCKVLINGKQQNEDYSHFYSVSSGPNNVTIYLINDENLCNTGFEEEVILFAYNLNHNVLLSENTLINTTILKEISFIHLFKPDKNTDSDNSFNIEIEKLDQNSLSLSYELKRINFNGLRTKTSDISSQKINSNKIRYISNEQINNICGSLNQNEVCSLTITLIPSSSSKFCLNLSKNSLYYSKKISEKTLIDSVNNKNDKYFYIDIEKKYNIRLLINSYGQDLKYKYKVKTEEQEDDKVLPIDSTYSDGSNFHQIIIIKDNFSKCSTFCRLYIGISAFENKSKKETSSLFSIGYQYYDDNMFSEINLPINYFIQFTLDGLEEVNFLLYPFEEEIFIFELYIIKENENDLSEVKASISDLPLLTSSLGKVAQKLNKGKNIVNIKLNKGNNKSTFKFRVSNIEKSLLVIPMISSYGEKCLNETCYYLMDDLSSEEISFDNESDNKKFVYFYIPEKESSVISTKILTYKENYSITGNYNKTSDDKMKRTNWLQIPITYKEHYILIKIENAKNLTFCSTNYNKPNTVTLNYGEKRIFSLQRKILDNITFYINKPKDENKVIIKLHAIKGNGVFNYKKERYPLGYENAYKEDISIIIADETKIELIAINEKNGNVEEDEDFVFTIEYTISINNQFINEINYDKINSFKFYQNKKINEIVFYLNFADRETNDLNINIKIYSYGLIYEIYSYFVNNDFIQNRLKDSNFQPDNNYNSTGKIKTYIQGGKINAKYNSLTFSKLEISSNDLKQQQKTNYTFIYIIFKIKEINSINYNVKIDLYPYNINNINAPLARNHLFIQTIPSNSENYKLFLARSDIYYKESVKIDFVFPLQKNYYITHSDDLNENPIKNEENLRIEKKLSFGKDEISLYIDSNLNKKNILLNIIPEYTEKVKEASFIFSYKNTNEDEVSVIYLKPSNFFEVSGNSKNLNYTIYAPISLLTGYTLLIIRIYNMDDIKDLINLDKEGNYLAFYLLFSDIKPMFTKYEVMDNTDLYKWTTINNIKKGGDLYLTAICVVEDNEREIYFAYKGIQKNIKNAGFLQDLLDYIADHIFASLIILIVIIMIIGMLINICRAERKGGRLSSVKVDVQGQLMEDKADD